MPRLLAVDRRRQLLEVAADLFARHGFHGTTTAELAKSAGVTEPILYRHFASKLDLFITLIDEIGDRVIGRWKRGLEAVSEPIDRLGIFVGESPDAHPHMSSQFRILLGAITASACDPAILSAVRRQMSRLHGFVVTEVKDLQERNVVRVNEPAGSLAWLIIEIALGRDILHRSAIGARISEGSAEDRKRLLQRLLRSQ